MNENLPAQINYRETWTFRALVLVFGVTLLWIAYCYLGPPPDRNLGGITIGMTKAQVTALVGEPDWIESHSDGSELWAFRAEWGLAGLICPYYISFSPKGLIDSTVWS